MKLLVPIDFSDNSFHASVYALMIAKAKPGSSVHLLHVIAPVFYDATLLPDIKSDAIKSLEKISNELKSRCGTCKLSYSIEVGETTEEINKEAEAINSGLIVMGLAGAGKGTRFLFGSNSISLINKASCPVLIIPEASILTPPHKIVFATDYYDSDIEALQKLIPIATTFHAEIVIVHIIGEAVQEQSELLMIDFISVEIAKIIQYPKITYRVYKSKTTAKAIKDFCEFSGADLLVMSARKRSVFQKLFQKSITKDLSYDGEIPLLIYHVQPS